MVDEGLSVSLDWNLPSLQNITPSRTLSINFDPHGEIEEKNGDKEDHEDKKDGTDMREDRVTLILQKIDVFGIEESLEERKLVWNRQLSFNFVLVIFFI